MGNEKTKDADKVCLNTHIQFGVFNMSLIGTVIAEYVYDKLKHSETIEVTKSAEA